MNDCPAVGRMELFKRYEGNPILSAPDWPYRVHAVFNPGATLYNGETIILARVEDLRGFSHLTMAKSKDGKTNWQINENPTLKYSEEFSEERWGLEDARIIWMEELEKYAICYTSFSEDGPQVSLAMTTDFKKFDKMGALLPPEDKDASLFPRKFNDE